MPPPSSCARQRGQVVVYVVGALLIAALIALGLVAGNLFTETTPVSSRLMPEEAERAVAAEGVEQAEVPERAEQPSREEVEAPLAEHSVAGAQIIVHFLNYPESMQPVLVMSAPEEKNEAPPFYSGKRGMVGQKIADQSWSFDVKEVLLGQHFAAVPDYVSGSGEGNTVNTNLVGLPFAGPTEVGEVLEVTLNLERVPTIRGRLVDRFGEQLTWNASEESTLLASAHGHDGPSSGVWYRMEFLDDGSFLAQPLPYAMASHSLAHVREFQICCAPWRVSGDPDELREDLSSMAVRFPVEVVPEQELFDAGDLVLDTSNPLMRLQVRDSKGGAIDNVRVRVMELHEEEGREAEWRQGGLVWITKPDASGVAHFFAPNWDEFFTFGWSKPSLEGKRPIRKLQFMVSAPNYVTRIIEVPSSQRELDVILARSGSLSGRVRYGDFPFRVTAHAVPRGFEVNGNTRLRSWSLEQADSNEEWVEFDLPGLPPEELDIVLTTQINWEILRVPSVIPPQGGEGVDSRLESLDLSQVPLAEFILHDGRGARIELTPGAPQGFAVFQSDFPGSGTKYATSALRVNEQGSIVVPMYKGVDTMSGRLQLHGIGYRDVVLDRVAAGTHIIEVEAFFPLRVEVSNGAAIPEGTEWGLRLRSLDFAGERESYAKPQSTDLHAVTMSLPVLGRYQAEWVLAQDGAWKAAHTVELVLTEAHRSAGQLIVEAPAEFLDQAREN